MENEQFLRTIVILRERSAKKSRGLRFDTRTQAVISHRLGDRGWPNGTLNTRHCTLDWNRWERFSASWICCIVQTEESGGQTDRQTYTHIHTQNKKRHIDWKLPATITTSLNRSMETIGVTHCCDLPTIHIGWRGRGRGEGRGELTRGRGMAYKNTDFQ